MKNAPPTGENALLVSPLANQARTTKFIWCRVHGWGAHKPEQCHVLLQDSNASPTRKASSQDQNKPPGNNGNPAKVPRIEKEIRELKAFIAKFVPETKAPIQIPPPTPEGVNNTEWIKAF